MIALRYKYLNSIYRDSDILYAINFFVYLLFIKNVHLEWE